VASSAAKRYAQAVFSLGQEQGTLDAWGETWPCFRESLQTIVLQPISSIQVLPLNAGSRHSSRRSVQNVQPEARNLARMLIERNRTMLIPQIREMFDAQLRAERGIAFA
jgi:F0F1-type ATP synthase delta subunit